MKKPNRHTSSRLSFARIAGAVVVLSVLGFIACAQTQVDPGTSGETHFLDACTTVCGGGLECACEVCTTDCNADSDCARFGAGAKCVTSCSTEKKSCDVPCGADPDCAALGSRYVCDVGECRKRVVHPDAGNDDFASCAIRPPSTCTMSESCSALGCGGFQYDEQGCQRAGCSTDGDCSADQRCTSLECEGTYECSYQDGRCVCGGPAICTAASYCNPIATVGPRGDWVSLEVDTFTYCPIPPVGNAAPGFCATTWKISADGGLATTRPNPSGDGGLVSDAASRLGDSDYQLLKSIVNGPELRAALRDGSSCPTAQQATDGGADFSLTLSTETLSRTVPDCVDNDIFGQVEGILDRY